VCDAFWVVKLVGYDQVPVYSYAIGMSRPAFYLWIVAVVVAVVLAAGLIVRVDA
jgi:hypothetical protein